MMEQKLDFIYIKQHDLCIIIVLFRESDIVDDIAESLKKCM